MTEHRPPGRRRFLTDAEIDLWLHVTQEVELMPGRTRPQRRAMAPSGGGAVTPPPSPRPAAASAVPKRPAGPPPLAPLERRLRQKIARGRVEIEAAIDLHGMDQEEAHHALSSFIRRAHARAQKLVLVVTGKGKAGLSDRSGLARESGILRRLVPHWLRAFELRGMVLGFEEAAQIHGGAGALYVRLRHRGRGSGRDFG